MTPVGELKRPPLRPTRRNTGRVIDFWRHPLPNISVQVGDTLATTDKNGVFVVDDVPPTYDVSLAYTYTTTFTDSDSFELRTAP